jgi:aspartate 1-decarboxylase
MLLTMMKAKIHRATVTQCDMHYQGSISIDEDWLDRVGILPNEQVDVLNINTGARFTTYAIPAGAGVENHRHKRCGGAPCPERRFGYHHLLCADGRRGGPRA